MSTPNSQKVALVWTGPDGHVWPYHDETLTLVAGQRYQVEESLANYLAKTHPDHWQRPAPPKPQAAKE